MLGMGMNVGWHPEVPEGGGAPATSLLEETGQRVSRNELLIEILTEFEALYRDVAPRKHENALRGMESRIAWSWEKP